MARVAVFGGLVVDEEGNVLEVVVIADAAHYVVNDAGFRRHIPSEDIDRAVLKAMEESVLANREAVIEGMLAWMGQDDLFTKAAVETSIETMDEGIDELLNTGLPEETRTWLGLMGMHIVVDIHGDIIDIEMPAAPEPEM